VGGVFHFNVSLARAFAQPTRLFYRAVVHAQGFQQSW
jgi:hypothetical protein